MALTIHSTIPYVKPANFQPHVLIVESRYYLDVATHLLKGATDMLTANEISYEIITVPGALEVPSAIQYAVKCLDFEPGRKRYDAYVALGCVLKGETRHHEIVGDLSARGLQELCLRYTLALGNGLLTCDTEAQALERADPAKGNKGGWAAMTALQMLDLKNKFRLVVPRRWAPPKG